MKRDFDQVKFIKHNDVELPSKSTELAGAYDLTARGIIAWYNNDNSPALDSVLEKINKDFKNGDVIAFQPGQRILIDTDLQLADVPEDFRGDVKPRSGLALKHGITVLNSPGLIDADYRENIGVILMNTSNVTYAIKFNDRIAQFEPRVGYEFEIVSTEEVTEPDSSRNGGFGSTGK